GRSRAPHVDPRHRAPAGRAKLERRPARGAGPPEQAPDGGGAAREVRGMRAAGAAGGPGGLRPPDGREPGNLPRPTEPDRDPRPVDEGPPAAPSSERPPPREVRKAAPLDLLGCGTLVSVPCTVAPEDAR